MAVGKIYHGAAGYAIGNGIDDQPSWSEPGWFPQPNYYHSPKGIEIAERWFAGDLSLDDRNACVGFHAALRSRDALALRRQLSAETDPDVRVALAWLLGDVEALRGVIESAHPWSRVLALNALDYLGEAAKPAVPLLQKLATQKETPENLYDRWLAQRTLTRFQ